MVISPLGPLALWTFGTSDIWYLRRFGPSNVWHFRHLAPQMFGPSDVWPFFDLAYRYGRTGWLRYGCHRLTFREFNLLFHHTRLWVYGTYQLTLNRTLTYLFLSICGKHILIFQASPIFVVNGNLSNVNFFKVMTRFGLLIELIENVEKQLLTWTIGIIYFHRLS